MSDFIATEQRETVPMIEVRLPPDFSDLQSFAHWALSSETARAQHRRDSAFSEIHDFYDAMLPRLMAALDHLNKFPLRRMPAPELSLFHMTLAFAEVAPFVEQYGRTILPEIFDERRFVAVHDLPQPGER